MSHPLRSRYGTDSLEGFLFADIPDQTSGPPLTVLSLLARAGFDPWEEAKRLSRVSRGEAVSFLAAQIRSVLKEQPVISDGAELAQTLIGKLPAPTREEPVDVAFAGNGFNGLSMIALMMGAFALLAVGMLAMLLDHL